MYPPIFGGILFLCGRLTRFDGYSVDAECTGEFFDVVVELIDAASRLSRLNSAQVIQNPPGTSDDVLHRNQNFAREYRND